ncbi:MAG: hypothetical protein M1480_01365 [Bacteroidetes bacterium]|nr:hypothetical protein [Bacteroidota bacterium]
MNIADKKINFSFIAFTIIVVNATGLLLKYFDLDRYLIFVGFRFYLSFTLPLIIVVRYYLFPKLKEILIHPKYNKTFQPLGWIFLPLIIILIVLYFTKKIDIGDPDYFYEFGLSSIFDYPIYVIWNLPQLLFFVGFLILIQPALKFPFSQTLLIILLLFAYEFIPLNKIKVDYFDLISFVFISTSVSLLIKYFQNIYWISLFIFTVLWSALLSFGSNSQTMIHILFAAQYQTWDGFFDVVKGWGTYLLSAQLGITLFVVSLSALLKKSK